MAEDRGFGRGRRGRGRRPDGNRERQGGRWQPLTKLGRLVDKGQIKDLEHIFKFSMPIKEVEIVDKLIGGSEKYKEEVMKVKPVQKQTTAGQRTRFKVWVLIGSGRGHIGLGHTSATGKTRTQGNFLYATYYALRKTYYYLTPEFWGKPNLDNALFGDEHKKAEEPEFEDVAADAENEEADF